VRKLIVILAAAALVATPPALSLDRAQARAVVRIAVRLSGLSERQPVHVVAESPRRFRERRAALLEREYPSSALAYDETVYRALGLTSGRSGVLRTTLLGLLDESHVYDPRRGLAFVATGPGERQAALRGVIDALEDQHFRSARIGGPRGDARLAARAAFEGYAELSTRSLLGATRAARARSRLARFLELERRFGASAGLRFVTDLRDLGGSAVTLGSLRRPPATTEQVLHLDKYLEREPAVRVVLPGAAAGMRLRETGTFGELDVRTLLSVFGVPRLDRAAAGWAGGRTARYARAGSQAVAVVLVWDTQLDAAQWGDAVARYVGAAFGATSPAPECAVSSCWRTGSRTVAFDRSGRRTALVLGADSGRSEALAQALTARS
jgi:hypothetical protein